jgi:hypothetical protein
MGAFRTARNVELSLIYYLETLINANWTGITTVKSFNSSYKASLPVVAIYLSDTDTIRREVGSTSLLQDFIISIDIFATSDGLRLDLADYIINALKDGCIYYSHSQTSGAPATLTRVADGRIFVTNYINDNKINFGEDVDVYDKYRHFIQISVRKSE